MRQLYQLIDIINQHTRETFGAQSVVWVFSTY